MEFLSQPLTHCNRSNSNGELLKQETYDGVRLQDLNPSNSSGFVIPVAIGFIGDLSITITCHAPSGEKILLDGIKIYQADALTITGMQKDLDEKQQIRKLLDEQTQNLRVPNFNELTKPRYGKAS